MTVWRDDPVPQAWHGLWRRLTLEEPDGSVDLQTTVLWMQASRFYCDIRVPPERPDFSAVKSFADLNETHIRFLASQEAFAGTLRWRGEDNGKGEGHWVRSVDFSPPAGPDDEGRLIPDRRMMVEYGIHRDYIEYWWQEAPAASPLRGGLRADGTIIVQAANQFMMATDRRSSTPAPGTLEDRALDAIGDEVCLRGLLDCEVAFGEITDNRWTVSLSTLPWRERRVVEPPAFDFIEQ